MNRAVDSIAHAAISTPITAPIRIPPDSSRSQKSGIQIFPGAYGALNSRQENSDATTAAIAATNALTHLRWGCSSKSRFEHARYAAFRWSGESDFNSGICLFNR